MNEEEIRVVVAKAKAVGLLGEGLPSGQPITKRRPKGRWGKRKRGMGVVKVKIKVKRSQQRKVQWGGARRGAKWEAGRLNGLTVSETVK